MTLNLLRSRNRSVLLIIALTCTVLLTTFSPVSAAPDLNIHILYGDATHGPKAHNYPAFYKTWKKRLSDRGVNVSGSRSLPTADVLTDTHVLAVYRQGIDDLSSDERKRLDAYVKQGGGLAVLHSGSVSKKHPDWYRSLIGGAFEPGHTKYSINELQGYYFNRPKTSSRHPIIHGVSNMDLPNEEVYWKMHMADDVRVLARSYHKHGVIAPQMWTRTHGNGRVFVWLTGHRHTTFDRPPVRGVLLRSLSWVAGQQNVKTLLTKTEKGSLKYHEGGPVATNKAASTIDVHPDFNLKLVAAEPMISNPIYVRFGPRGNLWVAEANEYPEVKPDNRTGLDKISVLKDTDGDGQMDRKQVFADDLSIVTSFVFYRDGLIVSAPPQMWYIRDTNGDLKAEKREKIFTGLGTMDTHATTSNLNRGFNGWIYANNGYSESNLKTPSGKKIGSFVNGVYRFKPDGTKVQTVFSQSGNNWGNSISPRNEFFQTIANSAVFLLHYVFPEWQQKRWGLTDTSTVNSMEEGQKLYPAMKAKRFAYEQIDWKGKVSAGAGSTLYTGGAWPDAYHMNHFISDPTVWLTRRDVVKRDGVSSNARRGRPKTEFMRSTDYWHAPVNQRIGPDGALYIVDFYRQAVAHNDSRGGPHGPNNAAVRPDRYNELGRIWRIQHKDAESFSIPNLKKAGPQQLVNALAHKNRWVRKTAQRLLVDQRMKQAEDPLRNLLNNGESPFARIHALWTLNNLRLLTQKDLRTALTSSSSALKKNACQVITERGNAPDALHPKVRSIAKNAPDDLVRLRALISLKSFSKTKEDPVKKEIKSLLDQVSY